MTGTESKFETKRLPAAPTAVAPDGSDVRVLLELRGGGLAHFELGPGETSVAVRHRTVEEICTSRAAAARCGGGPATVARWSTSAWKRA